MQLKMRNPQKANQIQSLMTNNTNPMELIKEITKDKTPEQKESFYNYVKQFGFNNDVMEQLQNGINTK